jgi:hypothetical protein
MRKKRSSFILLYFALLCHTINHDFHVFYYIFHITQHRPCVRKREMSIIIGLNLVTFEYIGLRQSVVASTQGPLQPPSISLLPAAEKGNLLACANDVAEIDESQG